MFASGQSVLIGADLLPLAGWYHAVSFVPSGVPVDVEDGVPRFSDVQ